MDSELISIIMPAKNASRFIRECLDSIVSQQEQNWELIIVNDNSLDDTMAIASGYSAKDSRIQVLDNNGNGIIDALKTGYRISKGKYTTRMDSDDIMPAIKLKELKNILISNGEGNLATGKVKYFPEDEIKEGFLNYANWLNMLCAENSQFNDIYKECVVASPCWMIHRTDFEALGAFDSSMYPEDYELVFRFYKYGLQVVSSQDVLHLWRDHPYRASRNDENYSNPHFFKLKTKFFLELEFDNTKELVLWGTGPKGKALADNLLANDVSFTWMCNNERKYGVNIKGLIIEPYEDLKKKDNYQLIIAISQRNAVEYISYYLGELGLARNKDYFFFC
ncbi:MAG: glycosyltransferase family 2 protein [Flavobacteriales bacterium]|nr:glycosyltransferase family 2 protein [Flavobacteriales bacterium]